MKLPAFMVLMLPLVACAQTAGTDAPATAAAVLAETPTPVVAPEVVPGTFWIYYNGKFNWPGDYSYGNQPFSIDYSHSTPTALSGKKVVLVSGDCGWQPYAPNFDFDTKGYNYVTVSIRPSQEGNTWISGAEMIGDKPIPGSVPGGVNLMKYGPNPAVVGQWNTYKIPLSAYSITPGLHIYKIMFQEQTSSNKKGNKVEFDNIGFVP